MENELTWRRDEIRHLRNLGTLDPESNPRNRLQVESRRRALLVMLYAHLEGFVRFALEQYADAINRANISIAEAKPQLAAACLSDHFKTYRSSEVGDPHDPSGNRARQVMRDAQLVDEITQVFGKKALSLRVDHVSSADSNLSALVLRRNLALLGLEGDEVFRFIGTLDGLLKLRNGVAHGENINLRSDKNFEKLERRVFDLCEYIMRLVYEATRDELYRR